MVYLYSNEDDNFHPVYREMACLPVSAVPVGVSHTTTTTHTTAATARTPLVPASSNRSLHIIPPAVLPTARSQTFPTTTSAAESCYATAVVDFSTARAGIRKSATSQSFLEGGRRSNTGEAMPILIRPAIGSTTPHPLSSKARPQAFQVEPTTVVPMPRSGRL